MEKQRRVIALGFFDGVHLGHAALLKRVVEAARALGAVPAAVTFDRHPEDVIFGTKRVPLITSPSDRAELMNRLFGIQEIIEAHFDRRMMQMPWESFVEDFLVREHGAVHLVAGHDFHFGYKGEGNPERLKQKCARLGIGCDIIPKVELDGITISSTYIRSLLAQGEMERACRFLGHPYTLTAPVGHGRHLGSALGFPTVNLAFPAEVMFPALGVYATRVWVLPVCPDNHEPPGPRHLPGEGPYLSVTNVGVRPTVEDGGQVNAEGFLLDFDGDLYGRVLRLEFYRFLRPERKFAALDELRAEVLRNAEQTRAYFKEAPHA